MHPERIPARERAQPITLTRFISESVLSKRVELAEDGTLKKSTKAHLSRGTAERVEVADMAEFARLLEAATPNTAHAYGICEPRSVRIVSERLLAQNPGAITRSRANFRWPDGPAIVFFDLDADHIADPPQSADAARTALLAAAPELTDAPMVVVASSNSYLYVGDHEKRGAGSWHIYTAVRDSRDLLRFARLAYQRCWLAGTGRYVTSTAGVLDDRALIDAKVWQPERLDFVGGAMAVPPIEQRRPAPSVYNGNAEPFDSTKVPGLRADEIIELDRLHAAARRAAQPAAEAAREQRKREHIDKRVEAGIEEDVARTEAHQAFDEGHLPTDWLLYPAGGTDAVTVGEVLGNLDRWRGARFADPLEPHYRNDDRIAWLHAPKAGLPTLHSHAHGGRKYTLARPRTPLTIRAGQMPWLVDAVVGEMRATREFFDYGDRTIARVRDGRIIPATAEYLTDAIGRHVRFERTVQQRNKSFVQIACDTPRAVGRTILERHGERRLPKLTAVITAPLMRADGSLLTAPGHDPESGLYLAPDGSYDDRIPESPTLAEVVDAIAELWRPVADFPLEDSVSRGVLLAALLTAVVRPSLDTSPAFAIDAPTWGSGKTLLAKVISALAGVNFEPMAPPHDDEEAFKSLFAEFRAGARVICWDNLTQPLNGQKMSALAMLLTAPVFKGRVLGQTETVGVPNRAVFLVTGNNIVVTGDVMRRILVARITPPEERPELRSFAVDPLDMVRRERQRLVRSALVILRGYLTIREPQNRHCGPPTGAGHGSGLASYDQWNSLVRQAVVWLAREVPCGIDLDDPILSVTRNAEADPDGAHLVSMLVGCREAFGARWFTAADVIRDVTFPDGLTPTLVRAIESQREINPGFNERHLGKWLSNRRERIKGGLRFAGEPDPHSKVMRWRVEKCRQPTIAEA